MKKTICALLTFALLLACFVSCGKSVNPDISTDDEGNVVGTITVWGGSTPFHENYALGSVQGNNYDPDCDTSNGFIKKIKEKYPKLNVNIENKGFGTELNTALRNAKISNNMPDIVVGEQFIQSQIELNYFEPLEIPEATKKAIPDSLWSLSMGKDGKQYGYPAMTGTFALIYNKKIFREVYNLDQNADVTEYLPQSMDEIVEKAAYIKEFYNTKYGANSVKARNISGFYINAVKGVGSAYRNGLVMNMFGGGFTDKNGNFIVDCEENVKAFKWLTSLLPYTSTGNIATTNETDVNTTILTGNVAMCFEIAPLLAPFGGINVDDFGVTSLPVADGQKETNFLVGSTSYMITKECSNKKVAQDILEMMVSYDMQMQIYKTSTNRIPVRSDVIDEILSSTDEDIVKKNETMLPFVLALKTADNLVLNLPSFTKNYTNIWDTWSNAIQMIFTQKTDSTIRMQLGNVQKIMSGK